MKVIDLLNKIANGEELPKKIKYGSFIYERVERADNTYNYKHHDGNWFEDDWYLTNILNNEVEIIEDTSKEDKKINKLDCLNTDYQMERKKYGSLTNEEIVKDIQTLKNYINKIIDRYSGDDND